MTCVQQIFIGTYYKTAEIIKAEMLSSSLHVRLDATQQCSKGYLYSPRDGYVACVQ